MTLHRGGLWLSAKRVLAASFNKAVVVGDLEVFFWMQKSHITYINLFPNTYFICVLTTSNTILSHL